MKRSRDQLIARLKLEGMRFGDFTLTHEGDYSVDDADWNYKDVPHLHFVHELVEAVIAVVEDDKIVTINMQKVLGLNLPLTVFNYQSEDSSQIYFTTWLFFVLIVETNYESVGVNRTRVATTYSIGAPPLLVWCIPVIRWLIKRNYKNLMSADIPMRLRKGELRRWGYTFDKGGDSYSFARTMDIMRSNVSIAPTTGTAPLEVDVAQVLPGDGEYLLGKSDHVGLRLVRRGNDIYVFPRMCVHEGASLDTAPCSDGKLRCPWHGRQYSAYGTLFLGASAAQSLITSFHHIQFRNRTLSVRFI